MIGPRAHPAAQVKHHPHGLRAVDDAADRMAGCEDVGAFDPDQAEVPAGLVDGDDRWRPPSLAAVDGRPQFGSELTG